MTDVAAVVAKFAEVLRADNSGENSLLVVLNDPSGDHAIFGSYKLGDHLKVPRITVTAGTDTGESSELGEDGNEWSTVLVQVDVWSNAEGTRDSIAARVRRVLLGAKASFDAVNMKVYAPTNNPLFQNETLSFRMNMRYPVQYVIEAV